MLLLGLELPALLLFNRVITELELFGVSIVGLFPTSVINFLDLHGNKLTGYFYPAYKYFKVIDCGKPKSEQLYMWCQYWIIIAVFTGCERIADTFFSWLPFYSGAKLAFVVYLWHPDTKGIEYVYQDFLKPLLSKHTESVVFNLKRLRNEMARVLIIFWTRLMHKLQSRASEMLHQSVVESPSVTSQPIQDTISIYTPIN
ncbi:hypothetical protein L7F22_063025 [Adiantum nelumboides]|nr:hypothetical protein [Adiantum nelumboides]